MLPYSPGEMLGEARKTSPLCRALGALEGKVLAIRAVPKTSHGKAQAEIRQ